MRLDFSSDKFTRKYEVHCCISAARLSMASQTDTVSHPVQAACFLHMSHWISFRHWKTLQTLAKLTSQTIMLTQNWSFQVHTFTAHPQRRITQWKRSTISNLRAHWVNYRLQHTVSRAAGEQNMSYYTVTGSIKCGGCVYKALLLSKSCLTIEFFMKSCNTKLCFTQKDVHLTAEMCTILTTFLSHNG